MGNLAGFFRTHEIKGQTFRGKFRSIFHERIRASKKKSFVPTSFRRRATLSVFLPRIITFSVVCRVA